jgi:RNA polymerase-binding transcription factor DksA
MNHKDDALRKARTWLIARGAQLRDRVRRVQSDLGRARGPLPFALPDAAIVMENDKVLCAIESTATLEIRHVDHALERIDAGTFGICEKCGGPIGDTRLEVVPFATACGCCEQAA